MPFTTLKKCGHLFLGRKFSARCRRHFRFVLYTNDKLLFKAIKIEWLARLLLFKCCHRWISCILKEAYSESIRALSGPTATFGECFLNRANLMRAFSIWQQAKWPRGFLFWCAEAWTSQLFTACNESFKTWKTMHNCWQNIWKGQKREARTGHGNFNLLSWPLCCLLLCIFYGLYICAKCFAVNLLFIFVQLGKERTFSIHRKSQCDVKSVGVGMDKLGFRSSPSWE